VSTQRSVRAAPRTALFGLLLGLLVPSPSPALSLEEAWALALQRSPTLEAERALVRRAQAGLAEARAARGPEISFGARASYLGNPPEGITVRAGELGELDLGPLGVVSIPQEDLVIIEDARHTYTEFSAELRQPLYSWGKLRFAEQLAAGEARRQRLNLEERQREVRRELHRLYFAAVAARESIPLLEESVAVLEQLVADRRRGAELGELTRLAVLEMESRLCRAEAELVQAREGGTTALQALSLLLGEQPEAAELTSSFREELPEADEDALVGRALAGSPALRRAREELAQAETGTALSRSGAVLRPDVSLSLGLSVSGQALPFRENDWTDTWDYNLILGVGTRGTILDSGRSRARIRQAEEATAAGRSALELAARQLRLAVRQALQDLRVGRAELSQRQAALREAEEAERAARQAFEEQTAAREQWGTARLQLAQRHLEVLASRQALELSLAALEYLAGPLP
jgi:outer membrane protein